MRILSKEITVDSSSDAVTWQFPREARISSSDGSCPLNAPLEKSLEQDSR